MEHMLVREAIFDDFRSAVGVAKGLYGGIDYLPTMFYEFLHSKRHKVYVIEDDRTRRIVGLCAFEFCEEKRFVLGFAARIQHSLTGRGLWKGLQNIATDLSLTVQPSAKTVLTVGPLNDIMLFTKIHYIWNCLLYKFSLNDLPQELFCPSRTGSGSSQCPVRRVSYAESVERLDRDDSFQNFFHQFASEYIPSDCNRRAQPISRRGLRALFSTSELFISENDSKMEYDELDPKAVGVASKSAEIQAISYLASLPVECGLGVHAFLYGFDVDLLVQHLCCCLNHVTSICKSGGVVAMMTLIPICIDINSLEVRLRETIGETFKEPQERHWKTVLRSSPLYWSSSRHPLDAKL